MTIKLDQTLSPTIETAPTRNSQNGKETPITNDVADDYDSYLTIIHFNDCYNVEAGPESSGAAGFLTAVNQYRHLNPIILFSGDIISPSFMSTFTKGEQMIPVLDKIGVDCAVFGNHEFDFGVENLVDFTRRTKFPWLLSNVIDKETSRQLGDGQLYHVIERSGVKIGLVGLIEEEWLSTLSTLDPCDVVYEDFVQAGRQLARELKSEPHNVDYVIALTHSRTPNDIRLADSVPEIDLILGGHDHEYEIIKRPNCYIIKSGTDFRDFSLLKLKLNSQFRSKLLLSRDATGVGDESGLLSSISMNRIDNGEDITSDRRGINWQPFVGDISIERISCFNCSQDEDLKQELEKFVSQIDEKMGKVLGQFNCELDGRFSSIRKQETNLGNFVTDIMVASTGADLAILNSGTLRSDRIHPKGDFTMRDLFNILGYIDPIAVLQANGLQIWQALENGVSQWPKLEGRFPQVSGCSFAFDPSKEPGKRIQPNDIIIGDETLVLDKHYRLTTKAYLASGKDGYDMLKECKILVPGDETPDLTTSILNHFEAINIIKSNRITHHRQSLICLSRTSLMKLLDTQRLQLPSKFDGNNNNNNKANHNLFGGQQSFHKTDEGEAEDENCLGSNSPNDARLISNTTNEQNNGDDAQASTFELETASGIATGSMNEERQEQSERSHSMEVGSAAEAATTTTTTTAAESEAKTATTTTRTTATITTTREASDKTTSKLPTTSTPLVGSSAPTPTISVATKYRHENSCEDWSTCHSNLSDVKATTIGDKRKQLTAGGKERRPRNKRIMSLFELENEQCRLEPKVEGRIRILERSS